MRISDLFKIKKKATSSINDFYIGYQHFIIITIPTKSDRLVFDKIFELFLIKYLNVYWFSSYREMEDLFDYLINDTYNQIEYFIFIG